MLIALFSCTNKNFEKKLALKTVPSTVVSAVHEANQLRDYAVKLNQIDLDENLTLLKNKAEKEKFKYRIVEFKIAYNKCIDKLVEIESPHPKDKDKKIRELQEDMIELDAIWKYITANYKA